MKRIFLIISFFYAFIFHFKAQNKQQKWVAGISLAGAKYTYNSRPLVYVSPRLNISRYIFKGLILDAAFATRIGGGESYTSFDGALRYDFGRSNYNVVPYILVGASYLKGKVITGNSNFGIGNTFWFSQKLGMNLQVMYKYLKDDIDTQKSHIYPSVGIVYSFSHRNLNPRLWGN